MASLVIQLTALVRLRSQRHATRTAMAPAVYRGLLRTSICRVAAAAGYVTLAVVAATTALSAPGLAVASLSVFSGTQLLWMGNAVFDVRLRRSLSADPLNASGDVRLPR
jgi:hypothetical protein